MNNEIIEMLKKVLEENGVICGGGIIASKPENANDNIAEYLMKNYDKSDDVIDIVIQELMPINKPMRAKEVCEYIKNKMGWDISYQKISKSLRNRENYDYVSKNEKVQYTYIDDMGRDVTIGEYQPVTYFVRKW